MKNYNLRLFSYSNLFNTFVNFENQNKLPSRILLSGNCGIGKSTFVFHFINYILSKNEIYAYDIQKNLVNKDNRSYQLIKNLSHPNFFLLFKNDGKKNIEIEQVRNMINFLNKSTFNNQKKIIFIKDAEFLNMNSSNALLKSLEEANNQNLFILTHNSNIKILDTVKSRCINYKMNFKSSEMKNVITDYFEANLYDELNNDFKSPFFSPNFLINHINFVNENKLDLSSTDTVALIRYVIDNKSYKKNDFIINNFLDYLEIYFSNMYLKTKEYKYYNSFLKIVSENDLINKFNLDLDSFFIKFENNYLNI